ncbi:MAG: hypothetical protein Q7J98_13335 [Kiritimatiellia bacterium]|nr:hypothetical protein [Kiritimatiellia bacterium]
MRTEEMTREEADRIESVVRWIRNRHGYMAAAVVRLGRIHFTESVETAGILGDGPRVHLFFNRTFFEQIRAAELAAVLVHESLHFVFRHQFRAGLIHDALDRRLFDIACEAVINDIIGMHFPNFPLPGSPIRGMTVIGRDASCLSAEQVLQLMRMKHSRATDADGGLAGLAGALSDDHSVWDSQGKEEPSDGDGSDSPEGAYSEGWTWETDMQVEQILSTNPAGDACGTKPLGKARPAPRKRVRKDLRRYLLDVIKPSARYRTLWNRVPRKSMAVYPDVILPWYEPENRLLHVLIAVDASGSIPADFLARAVSVARQKIPGSRITLISFDTKAYEFTPNQPSVRGGGGTRVQTVEEYAIDVCNRYPDVVILFSDGFTPSPRPSHPDRWIWILPSWGSTKAIPRGSRFDYFKSTSRR